MRPMDFAGQLNISLANGWGIVRTVTDLCMKMPEGKYVLVKDPNRVSSRFYAMQICGSLRPLPLHLYCPFPPRNTRHCLLSDMAPMLIGILI